MQTPSVQTIKTLLDQLPTILSSKPSEAHIIKRDFEIPPFHKTHPRFPEQYTFDELNNQIIVYLQACGYRTPEQVIELPKIPGADLVMDVKGLFELNKTGDIKSFAQALYDKLVSQQFAYCAFECVGIFINITVSAAYLIEHTQQVLQHYDKYGTISHPDYTGKKLLMEYSSPNMAKSMSIGHFRNTIIGQIIYNILQQTGCDHFNWNYIGDRGTAFGKFVTSLHYHYQQDPSIVDQIIASPESMMGVVYGKFKEIDVADKEEKARLIVQLLEAGDTHMIELRTQIRTLSLVDFETVYKTLGIEFDCTLGESFAVQLDNNVLQDLQSKHIVHESQGALIIKLKRTEEGSRRPLQTHELEEREEGKDQVLVFAKSDGSTLYAPRDLALLKYRSQVIQADHMIYVVGSEQSVYFQQIIALGIYLGYIKDNQMMHLGYGLYLQNGKKMASRTGGAYRAMELIEEITQAILQQFEERIDYDSAQKLAVSALIINDTKGDISKDVNLDIPSMTKLNGDTGVYVQYTAVRLRSLLEKIKVTLPEQMSDAPQELSAQEHSLLFQTSLLSHKIKQSLQLIKPHILTQYLLDLSGRFNQRYNDSPKVLEMSDSQKISVYIMLSCYQVVFEKVMKLLHLPTVEKM